ncbi:MULTISPECIES: DJ-1/PfpI family protein [Mammaliicoccus]|uniref:DJ-1/PfpI family protein n=1 Tax=Mammaliicoccus TaxID=2803850 RepID=UPI0018B06F43|nr:MULTISPECIES: DJ-1/PfpI family protein [Mammaliicoccus]MBF9298576.1 DJ-1/PfpI family protein [Staphylococcus schleiferi]MCJ1764740.1 DJ-1/PfpI family protein [Mammaliicoccus sciuri]MCJ1773619.1 DJ-1/PfpI family protein [Mammaliicoccus sciuri]MDO0948474.1 DJ-1/PfpI family protein [Mammaliicoccus sciuri]MDO0954367.1 DJ-1/PfpI family protein [Mammaliicoccus sciuri]
MKNYIVIFEECSLFEVVLLAKFLRSKNLDVSIVSDQKVVKTHEGFTVNADYLINEIDIKALKSLVITGGNPSNFKGNNELAEILNVLYDNEEYQIGSICGGNYIISSLLNINLDLINTNELVEYKNILAAPPYKYVDFAIQMGSKLDIYDDNDDLEQTIKFFKEFKNV